MMNKYKKWDIILVDLNPTTGSEISKVRPCLVVSPNKLNIALNTLIIIPLTSTLKNYSSRLLTNHKGKSGSLAFDQIRAVDKTRIKKIDGELDKEQRKIVNTMLQVMFSEL